MDGVVRSDTALGARGHRFKSGHPDQVDGVIADLGGSADSRCVATARLRGGRPRTNGVGSPPTVRPETATCPPRAPKLGSVGSGSRRRRSTGRLAFLGYEQPERAGRALRPRVRSRHWPARRPSRRTAGRRDRSSRFPAFELGPGCRRVPTGFHGSRCTHARPCATGATGAWGDAGHPDQATEERPGPRPGRSSRQSIAIMPSGMPAISTCRQIER